MGLVTGSDQKHLGSRTLSKTPLSTFAKHHKKGAPENIALCGDHGHMA